MALKTQISWLLFIVLIYCLLNSWLFILPIQELIFEVKDQLSVVLQVAEAGHDGYCGILFLCHHVTKQVVVQWTGSNVDWQSKVNIEDSLYALLKGSLHIFVFENLRQIFLTVKHDAASKVIVEMQQLHSKSGLESIYLKEL